MQSEIDMLFYYKNLERAKVAFGSNAFWQKIWEACLEELRMEARVFDFSTVPFMILN